MVKLDLGCGTIEEEGWTGVDVHGHRAGVLLCNLGSERWPFDDDSVAEARAIHVVQYLNKFQRVHFVNELWRVLVVGGKCTIVAAHWDHNRAYGDLDVEPPPISEHWGYFLGKKLRTISNPVPLPGSATSLYTCNFQVVVAHGISQELAMRSDEYRAHAGKHYRDAVQDIHIVIEKRPADEQVG